MTSNVAFVPYWLRDPPNKIASSDHFWWFRHLFTFETIIFAGPLIRNGVHDYRGVKIVCISTPSFYFHLDSHFNERVKLISGITLSQVGFYWHVMEATATCRVRGIEALNCPCVAVVGDTHHMKRPILDLIGYISSERFTHICCSHNQYNPFFSASCKLQSLDFPFCKPSNIYNKNISIANGINYYGEVYSPYHFHRTRIINRALISKASIDVKIHSRLRFEEWKERISFPQHIITCSLNGTFSFQTFLPLLYGCCLYSDKLSEANWVGSKMVNGLNCIIYTSSDDLIKNYIKLASNSEEANSISMNAKQLLLDILPNESDVTRNNFIGSLANRKQTTIQEDNLQASIIDFLEVYSIDQLSRLIEIFELIQEVHRKEWYVETAITIKEIDNQARKRLQEKCLNLLLAMLAILPRLKVITDSKKNTRDQSIESLQGNKVLLKIDIYNINKARLIHFDIEL